MVITARFMYEEMILESQRFELQGNLIEHSVSLRRGRKMGWELKKKCGGIFFSRSKILSLR